MLPSESLSKRLITRPKGAEGTGRSSTERSTLETAAAPPMPTARVRTTASA